MAYSDYKTVVMPKTPPGGWAGKLLRTDGTVMLSSGLGVEFIKPGNFMLVLEDAQNERMKVMVMNEESHMGTVWSTELLVNTKQV